MWIPSVFFNKTSKARFSNSSSKKQESEGIIEEPPEKFKPTGTVHYIPHHPVIRTEKSTSRVRIVYDAFAKKDGPSLNDCLETG